MAGERGPARREFEMEEGENPHEYWSVGEDMDASGGKTVLGEALRSDCRREGLPEVGERGCWRSSMEGFVSLCAEPLRTGEAAWEERMLDVWFGGRAKDCSKGFGSRSKFERDGRGWGRSVWAESLSSSGESGDWLRVDMAGHGGEERSEHHRWE